MTVDPHDRKPPSPASPHASSLLTPTRHSWPWPRCHPILPSPIPTALLPSSGKGSLEPDAREKRAGILGTLGSSSGPRTRTEDSELTARTAKPCCEVNIQVSTDVCTLLLRLKHSKGFVWVQRHTHTHTNTQDAC